ncbi:hypothetical protein EXIGLDRAFT_837610, partial [Exidia glandulosa HHB12029]
SSTSLWSPSRWRVLSARSRSPASAPLAAAKASANVTTLPTGSPNSSSRATPLVHARTLTTCALSPLLASTRLHAV